MKSLCAVFKVHTSMREWLSGGVSPCQGEGRGFESRLALLKPPEFNQEVFCLTAHSSTVVQNKTCLHVFSECCARKERRFISKTASKKRLSPTGRFCA